MLPLLLGGVVRREVESLFPCEHGLMLGSVILENAADVFYIRHREDHKHKGRHAEQAIGEGKCDPRMRLDLPNICFYRRKPASTVSKYRPVAPMETDKN